MLLRIVNNKKCVLALIFGNKNAIVLYERRWSTDMCISNNDVGNKIRTLRKAKSLTQQELADAAGFNVQTIRSYEAGKYRPKMETLSKLASALDCTIFDLLGKIKRI